MLKKEIQETIKEVLELGSLKEADNWVEDLEKVVNSVGEKLEIGDKAKIGKLELAKVLVKGRKIHNPKTGEDLGMSEDKVVVKAKIK